MLNRLVELSLRYKPIVLLAFALIAVLGVRAWQRIPLDAFPDVTPVQVNVYTESPGLAPEDVERLITLPVESLLAGLPDVEEVRSSSIFGLSYISVYFHDGVDLYFARRLVGERLAEARAALPEGLGEPTLGPNSAGLGQVFWYTLEAADLSVTPMELRTAHDWGVRMILRTTPGVEEVLSWGGEQKQYQVLIDPDRLIEYGLDMRGVMNAIMANNRQVGGQYIELQGEQYDVRGLGRVRDLRELGAIALTQRDGVPVLLRDVAELKTGAALDSGAVTKDGKDVVLGITMARTGENARRVVESVRARLETAIRTLPERIRLVVFHDRSELIDKAIHMANTAIVEGAVLVIAVLLLFLGNLRCALIVVLAIPLARLVAFLLMEQTGMSANLMSLGGLIIGLGMTIDGPVVLVENVFRTLRERADHPVSGLRDSGLRDALIARASREVLPSIVFGVMIIVLVFVPLLALQGIEGKIFTPLALNMVFAMLGSLVLTVTLMPVLCSLLLRESRARHRDAFGWIRPHYERLLRRCFRLRAPIMLCTVALSIATVVALFAMGREFMPNLQEQGIVFRVTTMPSTSLAETTRLSKKLENALSEYPEIEHTLASIGRAERAEIEGVHYMEIIIRLHPRDRWPQWMSYDALADRFEKRLEQEAPHAVLARTQPIQMRVEELISGFRSALALKIHGPDLATLDTLAARARDIIAKVPGARDLALEANRGKPQIVVQVRREDAARLGVTADDVMEVVRAGIGGVPVGTIQEGVARFAIQVRLPPAFRDSLESIAAIPVHAHDEVWVPLSRVADVELLEGHAIVRHEGLQRQSLVQLDVFGRDLNGFVREADQRLQDDLDLPTGYWREWAGSFENQQRAMGRLAMIVPLTIVMIFVLLYTAFLSWRQALLVLANVPFAAIGGVAALWISGHYLSVPAAVGFVAVFGVAMLNGIVLVSVLNQARDGGARGREAVIAGSLLRLRPVLMTAFVEILGLIPFLLATGVGAEVLRPLAAVVVGGLFTATVLTLILLPLGYEWIERHDGSEGIEARNVGG